MRIVNKKAKREYIISEEIEAGLVLTGSEVKSLRSGRGRISEAFARIVDGEVWIHNFIIPAYRHNSVSDYDPARPRKLLLHKKQIISLQHKMEGKRLTLVPLVCYTTGRFVKVRLGVGKGKKQFEKREAKKRKDLEREVERDFKNTR